SPGAPYYLPGNHGPLGLGGREGYTRLEAANGDHPSSLGNFPEIVGNPEGNVVDPRDQRKALRHDADDGSHLAVNVNGLPDDIRCAAEPLLPCVVADHDGARLFLLDPVVEIVETIRPTEQRFDADD